MRTLAICCVWKVIRKIKGGQHLVYPADTPLANLMLTLLNRGGVEVESHGNSTGILTEV